MYIKSRFRLKDARNQDAVTNNFLKKMKGFKAIYQM